jgi:2-methylcitrate dehydratase
MSDYDEIFLQIGEYILREEHKLEESLRIARYNLFDAIGCAMLALTYPSARRLIGPVIPGVVVSGGSRLIGTSYVLDPWKCAFDTGVLIRYLDFNDTWLSLEWGHPSDNLGALISLSDYLNQNRCKITVKELLIAFIKAVEIQGVLALGNSFNQRGFDHVILVKLASAAVSAKLLTKNYKLSYKESLSLIMATCSHVLVDGHPLRTYRHAPNASSRKSWAAGDASMRGLQLAWLVCELGESGLPSAGTVSKWGFNDVILGGNSLKILQPFDTYVMENILFKISYPAEFHAQTALEAAIILHERYKDRLPEIKEVNVKSTEAALRIISKKGPLLNPAARDHCLEYIIAVGLLKGSLTYDDYEEPYASNPTLLALREKITVIEDRSFTASYYDLSKRSISNEIQLVFHDGSISESVLIEYPLGHRERRSEGIKALIEKANYNFSKTLPKHRLDKVTSLFLEENSSALYEMEVKELVSIFTTP